MLTYNSQLKKLVLPEYGRNVQQMVDYCLTVRTSLTSSGSKPHLTKA